MHFIVCFFENLRHFFFSDYCCWYRCCLFGRLDNSMVFWLSWYFNSERYTDSRSWQCWTAFLCWILRHDVVDVVGNHCCKGVYSDANTEQPCSCCGSWTLFACCDCLFVHGWFDQPIASLWHCHSNAIVGLYQCLVDLLHRTSCWNGRGIAFLGFVLETQVNQNAQKQLNIHGWKSVFILKSNKKKYILKKDKSCAESLHWKCKEKRNKTKKSEFN